MKSTGSLNLSKPYEGSRGTVTSTISKDLSNAENTCQNDISKEPLWKCRYVITLVSFLIILSTSFHRTIMGVVIVAMVNNTAISRNSKAESESCLHLKTNTSEDVSLHGVKPEGEFFWSPETQGYILGCFFFGHIFTLMPGSRLAERYGCKWILVGTLLATSLLTMLIPPFARLSSSAVIVIQILRGLVQGMPLPSVLILMANWTPKTERGFLFSIIQTAHFLGPTFGNIITGYINESPGRWPFIFYIVGGLGLLLGIYMIFFISENPKEHTRISQAELHAILSQQETKLSRRRPKLPWRQVLTSVPVHAAVYSMFGQFWIFSQFWTVHSTFLGTILHYPIRQNGLFSAVPYFFAFVISVAVSFITGWLQKAKIVSMDFLTKFWCFISSLLYSLCLFGIYMAECNRNLSVIFSTLSLGAGAMQTPGVTLAVQEMSPTFAGTIYAITSTAGVLASVILPLIVGYLTDENQTLEQWNKVFFISIGVVMSSGIAFALFGSARVQSWNIVDEENKKNVGKQSKSDMKDEISRF